MFTLAAQQENIDILFRVLFPGAKIEYDPMFALTPENYSRILDFSKTVIAKLTPTLLGVPRRVTVKPYYLAAEYRDSKYNFTNALMLSLGDKTPVMVARKCEDELVSPLLVDLSDTLRTTVASSEELRRFLM